MRTIQEAELQQSPEIYNEMASLLHDNKIICIPTAGDYRLVANVLSVDAIIHFQQIKRRTKKTPVLVFVPTKESLTPMVSDISETASKLMDAFWPGSLTLVFDINSELPRKIRKNIGYKRQVGIRIPSDPVAAKLCAAFGGPLLVSSANISRKAGSYSEAQIRKNFGRLVDLMISRGDIRTKHPSTVVDVTKATPLLKREGVIPFAKVMEALAPTTPSMTSLPSLSLEARTPTP